MVDDYKYSPGRLVVYRHPEPGHPRRQYGQYGSERTLGRVRSVEPGGPSEGVWYYRIENVRTGERAVVAEPDIHYATYDRTRRSARGTRSDSARAAEGIARALSESFVTRLLRTGIRDMIRREQSEDRERREGRDLPIQAGDYVRVRGDLRPETQPCHNHYAKILSVEDADISALETRAGAYIVHRRYRILLDDLSEHWVYDQEIKLYYTANGRATILNWRAAKFLAESFQDHPPYRLDYSYLEDHLFTRDELEGWSDPDLKRLFVQLLYVRGRMGLRDLESVPEHMDDVPREHLVDGVLAISRFDMRRNRTLTPAEIERKKRDAYKLRRLLRGP